MSVKHYDINLRICPSEGRIQAGVELDYIAEEKVQELSLLLHRDLAVERAGGRKVRSYTGGLPASYPFAPEAANLTVQFKEPLDVGETAQIALSYSGPLIRVPEAWGTNCVTEEWVELGMYGPWFPWQPCTRPTFTYSVNVDVLSGYKVAGLGETVKTTRGWRLTSETSQSDIVLIASPDLETFHTSDDRCSVKTSYKGTSQQAGKVAPALGGDVLWILNYYRKWLQDESSESRASMILSPRQSGGGYARPGLVVLTNAESYFERPLGAFKFAAHEFAHLWWSGAPVDTWEDWLNEGLAEYSSLMATRSRHGQEVFDQLVTKKREAIRGLPPVRGIERTSETAYEVLYNKASLLLINLAEATGTRAFDATVREFYRSGRKDTETFLSLLAKYAGQETAEEFDKQLSR